MAIDKKTKAKLINAARKLSLAYKPRQNAKNKQKIDKALFKCSKCHTPCYEGSSQENYQEYLKTHPNALFQRGDMDHISPVIDPTKGWESWEVFYDRLFCAEDNWRYLCKPCHEKKTISEGQHRISFKEKMFKKNKKKS